MPYLRDAKGEISRVLIRGDDNIAGVIQAMEVLTPPVGRNPKELIRQVKAYQHVRATGEVMPSGWTPGQPTLTPGPDLPGNVWKVWKP